jgi:hypothetical protein
MYLSMLCFHTLPGAPLQLPAVHTADAAPQSVLHERLLYLLAEQPSSHCSSRGHTQLTRIQHLAALLAEHSSRGGDEVYILLQQLARVQRLAASWLNTPPHEQPFSSGVPEGPVTHVEMLPFNDQVHTCNRRLYQSITICKSPANFGLNLAWGCHTCQWMGRNSDAGPYNVE